MVTSEQKHIYHDVIHLKYIIVLHSLTWDEFTLQNSSKQHD